MAAFTLILRGVRFDLDEDSIRFDAPNYFTSYFFGGFKEAAQQKRELALNRHPGIFRLIFEYLSGYEVFPLADDVVPGMSTMALLQNLKRDALFYGLDGLGTAVDQELQAAGPKPRIDYQYTLYVKSLGHGFGSAVAGYHISEEQLPHYLEHFKRGELGSQARGWLPLDADDEVIAVWDKYETITTSYAIARRSKQ